MPDLREKQRKAARRNTVKARRARVRVGWAAPAVPRKKKTTRKRWIASVKTDATHPAKGLFTKDAATIARTLASRRVSPKGPASGMRMLTYFVNRGGRGLSPTRRAELDRAKRLLSERVKRERERRERKSG